MHRHRLIPSLLGLLLCAAALPAAAPLAGQGPTLARGAADVAATAADSAVSVYLVTFGPGDVTWERFGHNAIWIHDPRAETDIAYHYGLFDMSEDGFLLNFLRGRMRYSMGDANALAMIEAYRRDGRDVWVQELEVTPRRARELQAFLEWNMRPENRLYLYDYFRDNCSTRVRDALDDAIGGELVRELTAQRTDETFRSSALDLTASDELLTTGIDIGLGQPADHRLTGWEASYIPMDLRDRVRQVTVSGPAGGLRPLVRREWAFVSGEEPVGLGSLRTVTALGIGVAVGALFVLLGWLVGRGGRATAARVILATMGGLWALITGLLGSILLSLWAFTNHTIAHSNENLLQLNPVALALVALIPLALVARRPGASLWATLLTLAIAALSLLGLVLQVLPGLDQSNGVVIALLLPGHLALAWAMRRARRTAAGT